MLRRHVIHASLALLAFCILFSTSGNCQTNWHQLTQLSRNQAIVDQTFQYSGQNLGPTYGQCKTWANTVVSGASRQVGGPNTPVTLPANSGANADGFYWNAGPYVYSHGSLDPSQWVPGMIVQMRIHNKDGTYGPHTAIVVSNCPVCKSFTFMESNYYNPPGFTVDSTPRQVTYDAFKGSLEPLQPNEFTVYEIY